MYAREDTVNWLLAKRANTGILGGPLKQSCIHLASARRSGQASQVRWCQYFCQGLHVMFMRL